MKKFVIVSMVAAAGLSLAACSKSETATADNAAANVTEMNADEAMNGTTTDAMTNVDATNGADANMAADANATMAAGNEAANAVEAPAAENAAK
jgi:predicted lipoprotein